MADFINVDGDPNEVRATAAMIRSLAESFGSKVQGILGEINATDGARPWGSDEFGQTFERDSYNRVGGDGTPASAGVKDRLSRAGDLGSKTAARVINAMDVYQAIDSQGEADIKSVRH